MKKELSYWKRNLNLLERINKKLAYQLMITDPSSLEFCYTEKDQLNLKRTYQERVYYYHSQIDALTEAIQWFQNLNIQNQNVLFVYGVGLGYYYEAAKEWLMGDKKRALVFIEEDLGVLYRLLETEKGHAILKHPQISIVTFSDLLEDKETFSELGWDYIFSSFLVSSLKLYEEVNPTGVADVAHQVSHEIMQKSAFAEEYLHFGVVFFRNFYPNLFKLREAYLGNRLFDQFKQIPAIICGAGPSLDKNISVLKTLTQRALIFAGSSALPALISKELIPHFGAAIDPHIAQLPRVESSQGHGIPFFYRNRLFHDALKAIRGPKLYLTGSGGYRVADWFEKELGIESEETLDEGHNIVNFCIEIAHALGCNPIILVGVDLAFTDQQPYADGVISTLKLTEKDLQTEPDFESQPILKQDIYGNPVYTLWKWVTESDWTAEFAEQHPDISLINCTEGGLGFKNVLNQTLSEAAKELHNQEDLYSKIQKEIPKHSLADITTEQITELMLTFQRSLQSCVNYLDILIQEMDKLITEMKHIELNTLETPITQTTESLLQSEIGYQFLLDTFNIVYLKCRQRDLHSLQFPTRKLSKSRLDKKKIELQKERLSFLKDVSRANIELINWALRIA